MNTVGLLLAVVAGVEPLRLGDDGFRIGQAIRCSVLSPDGRHYAAAGERGGIYLLDAMTGRIENAWDVPAIEDLAFDGDELVVALSADGWVRTYHAGSGQPRGEVLLAGVGPGERLFGGFLGGNLLWRSSSLPDKQLLHDSRNGRVVLEVMPVGHSDIQYAPRRRSSVRHPAGPALPTGHQAALRALAFADASTVTTLDTGGAVLRWDAHTGALLDRAAVPAGVGQAVRLEPTGRSVLVRDRATWAAFDIASGRVSGGWAGPEEEKDVSPDGRWSLTRTDDRLHLSRAAASRTVALPSAGDLWPGGRPHDFQPVWSPTGDLLALDRSRTEVRGTTLFAWRDVAVAETATGRLVARIRTPDFPCQSERGPATERPVFFSPDGSRLVARWRLGLFGIYDARTGRLRHHFDHPDSPGWLDPLAWSPDGRCLLCEAGVGPSAASELWLVEVATGKPRWRHPAPRGIDRAVPPCFSPGGRRIAVALTDATVLVLPADDTVTPPSEGTRDDRDPAATASYWLGELDHDDFDRREAARLALAHRPEVVRQLAAAATSPSPHLRQALVDLAEERLHGATDRPTRRTPP